MCQVLEERNIMLNKKIMLCCLLIMAINTALIDNIFSLEVMMNNTIKVSSRITHFSKSSGMPKRYYSSAVNPVEEWNKDFIPPSNDHSTSKIEQHNKPMRQLNNSLDKQSGYIWVNGEFIEWQEAKVHMLSHTLHYGSGVFEGERAYNGHIFKMSQHHQRLHRSANMLGFEIPYSVDELNRAAEESLKLNNLQDAYLRPIAWHGKGEGLSLASYKNPINVAIAAWEWKSYFTPGVVGLRLAWADWVRPAPNMAPVHAKATGQYIIGTLSKNKAELSGYHDALMLDYRGYVAECTGANIFIVKGGVVYTPIADCFLNGITRQTVIEIMHKHNMTIIEKHILPTEIINADEVFITGSAAEVQPIIKIAEQNYSIGSITERIMSEYHNLVRGGSNE